MSNYYQPPPYSPQPPANYQPPPPYRPSPFSMEADCKPIRRAGNVIGGGLLIFTVLTYVLVVLLYQAFYVGNDASLYISVSDLIDESLNLFIYILSFWVATLFITLNIGIPAKAAFPFRKPKASICIPAIFVVLAGSVIGLTASSLIASTLETLTGFTPVMSDFPMPVGIAANIVFLLSTVVAPAVFEELLFRGVILQSLRRFGDGFALAVSSVLFAVMHQNLVQGPNALLMGLITGYFVLRTGSVVTGIILHFFNNGLIFLWMYLEEYLFVSISPLLIYGCYLLLGAGALVFLAVKHGNLFCVLPSDSPLPSGKKYRSFFTAAAMVFFLIVCAAVILFNFE